MAMSLHPEPARDQWRELRSEERFAFQRRAWCEHRELTLYLPVGNLSPGGLFIRTATPLRPGERLRVCLLDVPRIVTDVEIVWATPSRRLGGVGCRLAGFVQGSEAYSSLLEQLSENGW